MIFSVQSTVEDKCKITFNQNKIVRNISPNTPVSRDINGKILSVYKDNIWDLKTQGVSGLLDFQYWWRETKPDHQMDKLALKITDEIKTILFFTAFETRSNSGRFRGTRYLRMVLSPLRAIAKTAYTLRKSLSDLHNDDRFQMMFRNSCTEMAHGYGNPITIQGLIADLAYWNAQEEIKLQIPLLIPEEDHSAVQKIIRKAEQKQKLNKTQTPIIPTRIFGKLIGNCINSLEEFNNILENIESLVINSTKDPRILTFNSDSYRSRCKFLKKINPKISFPKYSEIQGHLKTPDQILEEYGLFEYGQKNNLKSIKSIKNHITHLQALCIYTIHAFSGMRFSEVQVMPFKPIANLQIEGYPDCPVLMTHLKKFSDTNYSELLPWATSTEGVKAVETAQKIAKLIWVMAKGSSKKMPENIPLFFLVFYPNRNFNTHYAIHPRSRINNEINRKNMERFEIFITTEDLDELENFSMFSKWSQKPEYQLGKVWPLTSHQFRRSVAVYASRSGMVGLPTLKTQFKHLSASMTMLYAANSSLAQQFLIDENGKLKGGENSIAGDWREQVSYNRALRFHEVAIKNQTKLHGAKGSEIQIAKEKGNLPKIFSSREETQKAIKQGRFSFEDTPTGGCTAKYCEYRGVDIVLPCTTKKGCKDSILIIEKIPRHIEHLKFEQSGTSPKSRTYKEIYDNINYLQNKWEKNRIEVEEI